jgi:HD-like signal output (HDOD) protein
MMSPEQIKERIQTIIQLPALPTVAMEVVEMVDNPKTSASRLGKVISTDQALTAKVLKIANSPFYGFPRKISTIDFAIIVLGYDALKEIVISISLVSSLQKKSDQYFDAKGFWDHSIASGVLARRLARDLDYRVSGEVFVGGLLHDMGISVLHRYFRAEFKRIVVSGGRRERARRNTCGHRRLAGCTVESAGTSRGGYRMPPHAGEGDEEP